MVPDTPTTESKTALAPVVDDVGVYSILRQVAFAIDAERVHRLSMAGLRQWSRVCRVALADSDVARHPSLAVDAFGLHFPNPIGLAAGFDKDAECVPAWQSMGFGHVEVGTVTRYPQPGNDKPRLFRLPGDRALLNRMGFNNHGADHCARALERWRRKNRVRVPLGVNIGKSKVTPAAEAAADYAHSFRVNADLADYVVVNVSSPNTPGLRDLQQRDALAGILDALATINDARSVKRPLLVKIAPDMADDDAIDTARLVHERGCAGLIVSNTTVLRAGLVGPIPEGLGGISGQPVRRRSTELLRLLRREVPALALVGVGGVADALSAREKLEAGASLLQAYTGFVYGGPGFVRRLLRGLISTSPAAAP